jgi:predicted amidohydrolase YtcJ
VQVIDLLIKNAALARAGAVSKANCSVAVRNGKISAFGPADRIDCLAGYKTQQIDAHGCLVSPGFHDAHIHLLSFARSGRRLDASEFASPAELMAAISAKARSLARHQWIKVRGWDECGAAADVDGQQLDAAAPHNPVRVQHRNLHLDILNTLAFRMIGDLPEACLDRDPGTGKPTGRLYHAGGALSSCIGRSDRAELAADVRAAAARLLRFGVTAVQDASPSNGSEEWALFGALARSGDLPLRLFMMAGATGMAGIRPAAAPHPFLQLGPVKLVVNEAHMEPALLAAQVREVRRHGRSVAIHATSEAELVVALAAIRAFPRPSIAPPDRIEHGFVIPEAMLPELRTAGVMVVGQPALIRERGDHYVAEFSGGRRRWLHRVRSLQDAGVRIAFGSDAPLTRPDPIRAIGASVDRRTASGAHFNPHERISLMAALRAATVGPAESVGWGSTLGRLAIGAHADLILIDTGGKDQDVGSWRVKTTIIGGKPVWMDADCNESRFRGSVLA